MSSLNPNLKVSNEILQNPVAFWNYLKSNSGLDSLFYDKDLLEGNDTEDGLYNHLNIRKVNKEFEDDLKLYSISVEQLIIAFFKTLQPFSQMMNDICVFFERHLIKETNQSLKISFDFDKAKDTGLDFNLEHFRQTLEQLARVKRLINYYKLNSNQLWTLITLFSKDYTVNSQNLSVRDWIDKYKEVNYKDSVISAPDIEIPSTGSVFLNQQLNNVIAIWKSFVNTCRNINPDREIFKKELREIINSTGDAAEKTFPWDARDLYNAESDFWPATLIDCIFFKLEQLGKLNGIKKTGQEEALALEIEDFLNKVFSETIEVEQLLSELVDLLKMPIWKKRYELYAAWVLTLIDDIFKSYPREIHHKDGKLFLSFSATHLATIKTAKTDLQLWAEVRSNVDGVDSKKLEGKSRTNNIQPDYAIYIGDSNNASDCIVAIEVKQYRKHSNSNFSAALNDYTRGLPNAHVFLVNYGLVSSSMTLSNPDRSHFFGQIKPVAIEIKAFETEVKNLLPNSPFDKISYNLSLSVYDVMLLLAIPIDYLFVDISASLDSNHYRNFIKTLLSYIITNGKVSVLVAVDDKIRKEYKSPDLNSVVEILQLPFNSGTEFAQFLPFGKNIIVITDEDGVKSLKIAYKSGYIIQYNSEADQKITILEDGLENLL